MISEGFVYLDRDGTCRIVGLIRTNIEPSFEQTIASPYDYSTCKACFGRYPLLLGR
jgi:hypothetical protein